MKFGVIGLGGIAQKAYLPTYSQNRNLGEFIFATRNPETRQEIQEQYGFTEMVATIDDLLAAKIDACFIHVATKVHYEVAKACLTNGVHVFMDKPISERVHEVKELQELAAEKELIFMTAFNRRFAPMVDELKNLPEKRIIQVQKNRENNQGTVTFAIYDLFSHVIDTAVYLLDGPIQLIDSRVVEKAGQLEFVTATLSTPTSTAFVTMDYRSGANTEIFQVTGPEKTLILDDLTNLTMIEGEKRSQKAFGNWDTTLFKRGFEQMVTSFISAVDLGDDRFLRQEKVLLTHEICGEIIAQHQRHLL
ncbi:Gfo/Idh/MocA family protein [Enterococcus sp. LJL120]